MSSDTVTTVLGVDAAARQWLGVLLTDGAYAGAALRPRVSHLLALYPDVTVVGIDIPIGLPIAGSRPADREARRFVGPARAASVFLTFPAEVLSAVSYEAACAVALDLVGEKPSQQAWGLRHRIAEVAALAGSHGRIVEVHPEVSFRALKGTPLLFSKHSWSGIAERRCLLQEAGIVLPDDLPGGERAGSDDVVDAAVAAWSAWRVAEGRAKTLPEVPSADPADGGVIRF